MTTLLFLPPAAEAPWRWLRIDGEAVVACGEGVPDADGAPLVAVPPADAVTLHWADLPDRSAAQAAAAARILVAEASAAPAESLHVAVGMPDPAGRPIAVVAAERVRFWLDALAAHAIDPDALVPAPLLLPAPAEGYVRADLAGQGVVRGATSAFADEARLTDLVTGETPPETLGRELVDAALVAAASAPALDLRQGPFARRRRRAIDWPLVRRLAVLAGLTLLATLAIDLVRIARYSFGADALEARAETLARRGLPRGAQAGDATRLLAERLRALRGPGAGFSATAAAAVATVQAVPGSEVTSLDFRANGDLRLGLATEGEAQANLLKQRLEQAGFAVEASVFQSSGGRLTGEMTVSAP